MFKVQAQLLTGQPAGYAIDRHIFALKQPKPLEQRLEIISRRVKLKVFGDLVVSRSETA